MVDVAYCGDGCLSCHWIQIFDIVKIFFSVDFPKYLYLMYRWCIELGREQASNKPLLRTVFQVIVCRELSFNGMVFVWSFYSLHSPMVIGHVAFVFPP